MKNLFIIILAVFSQTVFSQNLEEHRKTSHYTYIFKLTDEEADSIYHNSINSVDPTFLHSLVDSFLTDEAYTGKLETGHYIKAHTEKNYFVYSLASIQNFDVKILDNSTDLLLQVYDSKGTIITNADVRIKGIKLHFDKKLSAYKHRKSNKKGLLEVKYLGLVCYYQIERQYNNSKLKRISRKVLWETPLRIVWRPIRNTVMYPVDGVKSLIKMRPIGRINNTFQFFRNPLHSLNNRLHRFTKYFNKFSFNNRFQGYTVTNQPKYKPGDTVKIKAFIVNRRGKPFNRSVKLNVKEGFYTKDIFKKEILPYNKGGFTHELVLHDSLNMKLDKLYSIYFKPIRRRYGNYTKGSFKYEDYELHKNTLTLKTETETQYRKNDLTVKLKGTDENELNLQYARYELYAVTKSKTAFFDDYVFVPDTLFMNKGKLKPTGETNVILPDSIFPKANLTYEITVNMLTSDNEKQSESIIINYYYKKQEIKHIFVNDSITLSYEENGIRTSQDAELYYTDNFGNRIGIVENELPATVPLNAYYSNLTIKTKDLSKQINIASEMSRLQCYTHRNKDSVYIYVENPAKLRFTYFLYKANNEIKRGYTDSLKITLKHPGRKPYLFSIQYMWGGVIKTANYGLNYSNKNLNIKLIQPKLVYPGQTTKITVEVKDDNGKAIKDADLTAYALTKKFNYTSPSLPVFTKRKERKGKEHINSFHFDNIKTSSKQSLNYKQWKQIAGLDSMEYYKFLYPEYRIYKATYTPEDGITQFSPYVMNDGAFQKVHVVYVDDNPVYFSWMTNVNPYSFKISDGYHRIKLRLEEKLIVADSIYFERGKKTIFSLNINYRDKDTKSWNEENKFTYKEKNQLRDNIFPYRYDFGSKYSNKSYKDKFAYIKQDNNYQLLPPVNYQFSNLAGPISKGYIDFTLIDGFNLNFFHEQNFEYDFLPKLLKMREKKTDQLFPQYLTNQNAINQTTDLIMTKQEIEKLYVSYVNDKIYKQPKYNNPQQTYPEYGILRIDYKNKQNNYSRYINTIMFKAEDENFIRIYPGNTTTYHNLEKGLYKIAFIYPDSSYHLVDSVEVKNNGWNYHKMIKPDLLKKDSFSKYTNALIRNNIFKSYLEYSDNNTKRRINNSFKSVHKFTGIGYTVEGYVVDEAGDVLPGVSVLCKGTTIGTVTLGNGYFSMHVPNSAKTLVFSFIGMETIEQPINTGGINDAVLKPSNEMIEEVIVSALGISRSKKSIGYSVAMVSSDGIIYPGAVNTLQGKVAGINILGEAGASTSVILRGMSSLSANEKIVVIIDGVPVQLYGGTYLNKGTDFGNGTNDIDPELIKSAIVLTGKEAIALYGARAANGVIIISTKGNKGIQILKGKKFTVLDNGNDYDQSFFNNISEVSGLRTNFSDYAFWQPKLRTDKNGKAEFEVTFPDDITNWETHVLGINKKLTGKTSTSIKSYKPLSARLALPRFLLEGDTSYAIGKSLNYLPDSANITTTFHLNDLPIFERETVCRTSVIDTLMLNTSVTDTLKVKYILKAKKGYFDGEERKIPVFPIGLEKATGSFNVLDIDTTINLEFEANMGEVSLYAKTDALEILDDEISSLIHYLHKCNEQMASKLKAMMADKQISEFKDRKFEHNKEVKKLIRKLTKHQNDEGLWGWWGKSDSQLWITAHVLEALIKAESNGYNIKIDKKEITNNLEHELEKEEYFYERTISVLKILKYLNANVNYAYFIKKIEQNYDYKTLYTDLMLTDIKQACGEPYKTDWLKDYQRNTFFGNIYYSIEKKKVDMQKLNRNLHHNDKQATLKAYKILRNDSTTKEADLLKMRNFFFEERKSGYWRNTYESAKIIEALLPDLIKEGKTFKKPELIISSAVKDTVTEFPWHIKVKPDDTVSISKTGTAPIYFTSYQHYWDNKPKRTENDFIVHSYFNTKDSTEQLKAGENVKLIVELEVLEDADYVMLDIPIPAGCSYSGKKNNFRNEVHREYRKHKTNIYCRKLNRGFYKFEIELLPRYTGTYTLNPAKAELMYFPTFYANTEIKKVIVK